MNQRDAEKLIRSAVSGSGGTWADIGAGTGTFTRALRTLLGPNSRIYEGENRRTPAGCPSRNVNPDQPPRLKN